MNLDFQISYLLPELFLVFGVVVLAFLGINKKFHGGALWVALAFLFFSACALIYYLPVEGEAFNGLYRKNTFGDFIKFLLLLNGAFLILFSKSKQKPKNPEFYALLCSSLWGGFVLVSTSYFPLFLVGLETLSLTTYALCAWQKETWQVEAALKYFFLGMLSSAIFIYGVALFYGATGSLFFGESFSGVPEKNLPLLLLGSLLILAGFSFKLGAAPFHFWMPDVIQNTSMTMAIFLLTLPKIALFTALHNFFYTPKPYPVLYFALLFLGSLSLLVGNAMAFLQKDFKGLFAYSSIAHSGFIFYLVSLQGMTVNFSLSYYLLVYSLSNLGIFAVLKNFSFSGKTLHLSDFKGLFYKHPGLSLLFSFFLISLAGIPFTPGFLSKLFLFLPVLNSGGWMFIAFALFSSAVAAIYYLKIIWFFFQKETDFQLQWDKPPILLKSVYYFAFIFSLLLTLWPEVLLIWLKHS